MASLLLKDSPMRSLLAWATLVVLVAACRPDGAEVVPGAEGWLGGAAPSIAMPETRPGPGSSDETGALQAHQGLRAWLDEYTRAGHADRSPLELQGARLALQRRLALRALLLVDPERALTLAMSPVLRAQLPEAVAQHVERWRDGRGTLHVLCAMSAEGQEPAPLQRFVTFDGEDRFLRAGVFGARLGQQTREHARLHGVELDGVIALTESPLRQLSAGETSRALLDEVESPASGPSARAQLFHDGDAPRRLCAEGCAAALASQLEQEEDAAALQAAPLEASSWTEGPKPVLFIRVDFSDLAGDPVSEPSAKTLIESTVSNFFKGASYDKTSMTAVVTPTLRMTKTSAEYLATEAYPQLMTDARAAAKAAGFDTAGYTLDLIAFKRLFSGWAGMGYVGGKGTWLNGSFDLRVTAHELGHNYGSSHANFWSAGPSIIGAGTNVEYGNPLDIMGNTGTSNAHHFSSWVKRRFDWMTAGETQLVAASGTYRVHALETVIASGLHALKIPRNDSQRRDYWLEFRPGFNNVHQKNGVSIHFGYQFASTSHLLDMTPEGDRTSSALLIGRTFSDRLAGIHLTPVGKGGTTPESVDVVVNLGSFPGNRAPTLSLEAGATSVPVNTSVTFTATAGDPDGDALAYAWDFDDGSIWPNAPVVTKALSAQRVYSARCTVSDMKGQVTTAAVAVTVGSPTKFTLSGIITAGGQPLEGVRVSDGSRGTFTASDGHYLLAEVPAGTFTLAATKADYSFTAGFASPLAVSGSVSDLDFTATPSPGYTVSGTVTASGVGLAGVTVTDGSRSATTNSTGAFSLALVPNGRWMLAAAKAGWEFSPSGFTNPLEVNGGSATANFVATGRGLSGSLPGTVVTAPTVTDGLRTTTASKSGSTWYWSLGNVPNGSWNLVATAPGVSLVPETFANPVVVAGTSRSNLNFRLTASPGFLVAGTVRTGGTPLPGVVVSDGTRTSTTDGLGRYTLVGVPVGSHTLTPTASSYAFVPASLTVSVSTADLTGKDFSTTATNLPPTVVTPLTATPNPVTSGATSQLSVRGDDDSGEGALTYAWTATGSWPTAFSATGTNGARDTLLTFTGPGTYTVEVVISDPGGLSVRASLAVVVSQVATALVVAPASASVVTSATQVFQATLRDQFNRTMAAGTPTWTVSGGGSLSGSGTSTTFTAASVPGGPYSLTASAGGRTGSASITVVSAGTPVIVTPASATPNPVSAHSAQLSVRATDDGGEPALVYRWTATSAPGPVTFSANDLNAAKDTTATFTEAGDYVFDVEVVDTAGNHVSSRVDVRVLAVATRLDLQPQVVSLRVGETQQFSATVVDQFGAALGAQPAVTWSIASGGGVDSSGLFTAGGTVGGPYLLTVTAGLLSATASVTVGAAPDTTPPSVALTAPIAGARIDAGVTLVADAADNVGVVRVEFFSDATKLGEVLTAPYSLESTAMALGVGMHRLTARAVDAAGNTATSDAVEVTVPDGGSVDVSPPSVRVLSPQVGETTGLTVALSADASDDVGVVRVDFELDGVVLRSLVAAPWEVVVAVPEGAHDLVAVAHDAVGRFTRSQTVSFAAAEGEVRTLPPSTGEPTGAGEPQVKPRPESIVGTWGCSSALGGPGELAAVALGLLALISRRASRRRG